MLTFTFSNLYSHYGDNTYYTGTPDQTNETARYSFVTSKYFLPVSGNQDTGIEGVPVNDGLYDSNYSPNSNYLDKVFTSTAGNIRFKFNNAEDIGSSGSSSSGNKYLIETPFTVTDYLGSADPDGSDKTGQFI